MLDYPQCAWSLCKWAAKYIYPTENSSRYLIVQSDQCAYPVLSQAKYLLATLACRWCPILHAVDVIVLCPDPTPKRGKGFWWIWTVPLVWLARWVRADTAVVKQTLDLIGHGCSCVQANDSNLYSRQWRFEFLWLASHMTTLKFY